jgi:hypothetical protein
VALIEPFVHLKEAYVVRARLENNIKSEYASDPTSDLQALQEKTIAVEAATQGDRPYTPQAAEKLREAVQTLRENLEDIKRRAYEHYLQHTRNRLAQTVENGGDLGQAMERIFTTLETMKTNNILPATNIIGKIRGELVTAYKKLAEQTKALVTKIKESPFFTQ